MIPVLSKKNVDLINQLLEKDQPDLIVEFGSGGSTLFYLDFLNSKSIKTKFISVENTDYWFSSITDKVEEKYGKGRLTTERWSMQKYNEFFAGPKKPFTPIIEGTSRYDRWRRFRKLGPFYRLESSSGSKIASLLPKGAFNLVEPVIARFVKIARLTGLMRDYDARFELNCGNVDFIYLLRGPAIKDQFGESPFRDSYSDAWNEYFRAEKKIFFMIDGGPRHYIVDRIRTFSEKHPGTKCTIALFDAHRPEYEPILEKFPQAQFECGSLELADGSKFYSDLPTKELWLANIPPSLTGG
jgi:hypothetical protein